jgi:RimJ/RimL family protein N-acetyltransferase
MKNPFLVGERVYLRAVSEEDVTDRYQSWLSDPEVTRYMGWRAFPASRESIAEYVRSRRSGESLFLAIIEKRTDLHLGNIHLGPIDWVHRRAELAMLLGERSAWGKGLMTEAFELVTGHAFNALNLHKLKAGTDEGNIGAVRVFQKTGWVEEGRLRQETFREGAYRDLILFAKFNPHQAPTQSADERHAGKPATRKRPATQIVGR